MPAPAPIAITSVCGTMTLRAVPAKAGAALISTVRGSKQTEAAFFDVAGLIAELRKLLPAGES